MARISKYLKTLERLNQDWSLSLRAQTTDIGLLLLGVEFLPEPAFLKAKHSGVEHNIGLLLPHSQNDRKRKCLGDGTSFLDDRGEMYFALPEKSLHLKPGTFRARKISRSFPPRIESSSTNPYFLITPNALAISETLLRLPTSHLKGFQSGLKFCKQYHLYQPRFSEMARQLKVHSVEEMAKKIKAIRTDDWLTAFETTAARRFMTPFYRKAEAFYSLLPEGVLTENKFQLGDVYEKYRNNILPGPSEVAKHLGALIESNINLWVTPEVFQQLKKYKRLVPGQSKDHRTWLIAVAEKGFEREEISSHVLQEKRQPGDPLQNNILRAAWDLTYSDSRTREVRKFLLRRLMDET